MYAKKNDDQHFITEKKTKKIVAINGNYQKINV